MATSNRIRALNRLPFDFQDGLKVAGVDVTALNQIATANGAGLVGVTPVGGVLSTNVQAALAELDNKKIAFTRLDDTDGSSLVGYDGGTVQDVLDAVTGPNGAASVGYTSAGTGAVATTVQDKMRETVSVTDVGADPTGVADSGPAFRKAAAYIESVGGGVINVPPGLYRCASVDPDIDWPRDERHVVYLGSNTVLQGSRGSVFWLDGATLSGQPPFTSGIRFNCVAIKKGKKYSAVKGITFTTNAWVLDIAFRTCIGVTVGGDECQVMDNYFDSMPGRNVVYVGYYNPAWPAYNYLPQGVVIEGNTFRNGSKNVPGNAIANDCSFVYINAHNATVTKNRFFNTSEPVTFCGGVEMHGSRIKVHNNEFINLQPGIYTGFGLDRGISQGNIVTGNTFVTCAGGVQIIDDSDGIVITDNTFVDVLATSQTKGFGSAIYSSLNGSTGISGGVVSGAKINKNHIKETTPIAKNAIAIGGLRASIISENTFDGVSSPIGVLGASDAETNGVDVCNNIVINPVTNPQYYTGVVSVSGGDTYSSNIKNVIIRDNLLVANSGATNTCLITASGTGTTLTNVVATGNKSVNALDAVLGTQSGQVVFEPDSWINHNCAWTQASGTQPAIGNGTLILAYRRTGKKVEVWFRFVAGSTTTFGNNAASWRFSLPITATPNIPIQNAIMEVHDGASDMRMCSLNIGGGETTFFLLLNNQSVRLNYPFVSVSEMTIRGQFSYLTT